MIKESRNLIGWETQLATTNQKWLSQMLPSLDLRAKNLKYHLICSTYIVDLIILQFHWTRSTIGHTQTKVVLSEKKNMQKNWDTNWLFPEILTIKESWNLIGQQTQLVPPMQKLWSQMLHSHDDYLHATNPRYGLIPSKDIDDQIIMQSDWWRAFRPITEDSRFIPDMQLLRKH